MRPRRLLLATTALSTMAFVEACSNPGPPGNPKGSGYDPSLTDAGQASSTDAGQAPGVANASDAVIPPPANPKGSHYDAGMKRPPAK